MTLSQKLHVPIMSIDNIGDPLLPATIEQLKANGISTPLTAEVTLDLNEDNLVFKWKTPIGTFGTATAPKSRAWLESEVKPLTAVTTWDDFKSYISTLERNRYIFRGHEKHTWRLRTSFHRAGRFSLKRYSELDVNQLHKIISAQTSFFNFSDPIQFAAFLNLAQHHGYPTPLLDWTWSPYVAAFFAYRNIPKLYSRLVRANLFAANKIRICKLDIVEWNKLPRANKIIPASPSMTIVDPLSMWNQRAIPQQAISTFSNVDDIEAHIKMVEELNHRSYLEVIDLPIVSRNQIMDELALMNITAGSLFPGLDGACESLRERNF
jgi:FRG domain